MPACGDTQIVSCSGDGIILYTDLNKPSETLYNKFLCHNGTAYEIVTIQNDPNMFISCGEDGTVRCFDLRLKRQCNKLRCTDDVMMTYRRAVTALCINDHAPYELAVGCSDGKVRTFDRRMLSVTRDNSGSSLEAIEKLRPISCFMAPSLDQQYYRITSLSYSPDGEDILVSYSSDYIYLFGIKDPTIKMLSTSDNSVDKDAPNERRVRKLRLRGDWSDTGPDARPEREVVNVGNNGIGQARPQLQATLMQRMTDVLTRMLNDPHTRAALNGRQSQNRRNPPPPDMQNSNSSPAILSPAVIPDNDDNVSPSTSGTTNRLSTLSIQSEVESPRLDETPVVRENLPPPPPAAVTREIVAAAAENEEDAVVYSFDDISGFTNSSNRLHIEKESFLDETETTMPNVKQKFTGHRNAR